MLEEEHKYLTGKDPNSLSGFQPEIFQGLPKFGTKANDSQLCRPWTNFGLASHRITNETDPFLCLAGPTKIRDLDRVLNCSVPVAGSSAPVLFYPCSSLLLSLVLPIRPSCAITARQELRLYGSSDDARQAWRLVLSIVLVVFLLVDDGGPSPETVSPSM